MTVTYIGLVSGGLDPSCGKMVRGSHKMVRGGGGCRHGAVTSKEVDLAEVLLVEFIASKGSM